MVSSCFAALVGFCPDGSSVTSHVYFLAIWHVHVNGGRNKLCLLWSRPCGHAQIQLNAGQITGKSSWRTRDVNGDRKHWKIFDETDLSPAHYELVS